MAGQLVDALATAFKPSAYQDTYRDEVLDLIRRKARGEAIDLVAEEEPAHGDDLAAVLEASLAGAKS
jgi:DNA end-binding protein Ku